MNQNFKLKMKKRSRECLVRIVYSKKREFARIGDSTGNDPVVTNYFYSLRSKNTKCYWTRLDRLVITRHVSVGLIPTQVK